MNGSVAYLLTAAGCLVAVAGVVVAVVALQKSKQKQKSAQWAGADPFRDRDSDALRGDPRRLRPGDVVEVRGVSYSVRGSIHLVEGSWSWAEHLLDDAQGVKRWISVEEDPDLELVLWAAVPAEGITPGAPTIDFGGVRYTWEETGQARFTAVGSTGLDPNGTMRYHDYRGPGPARLSFEAYGAAWEAAQGELLHRGEVMIYPQGDPGKVG
ncbi:DUF4178 domain-containing protein [Micromonospora sp. NPDC000207]|uniref:DUF4178 domain-containing protein n=1 Tax=Micromonospora sp. NPDC000207 TaxID=3154246 RepID=UPI00331F747F